MVCIFLYEINNEIINIISFMIPIPNCFINTNLCTSHDHQSVFVHHLQPQVEPFFGFHNFFVSDFRLNFLYFFWIPGYHGRQILVYSIIYIKFKTLSILMQPTKIKTNYKITDFKKAFWNEIFLERMNKNLTY